MVRRNAALLHVPLVGLALVAVVGLIAGCSGGGVASNNPAAGAHASGSLVMRIAWPKTTAHLIPAATNSIQIDISYPAGGSAAPAVTIPQGQTTTTIGNLPIGNLMLTASALDANGAVTAAGTTGFTTVAGQQVIVSLNLSSTIANLVISPGSPVVTVGASTPLHATGVNTSGAMVLLTPSKLTWQMATTADATYASVDSSGNVTGIEAGTANVEVTDSESGKSATVAVTVQTSAQAQDEAICLANEQKIGQAFAQYESDYDDKPPGGLEGYGGGPGWAGQVYPYLSAKTTTVFVCPSDPANGTQTGGPWRASSYGYNSNFTLPNPTTQDCQDQGDSYPLTGATAPSRTVLLFEVTESGFYNIDTETEPTSLGGTFGFCGGSPAGNGLGGDYDPSGFNSTVAPTAPNDGYLKYATGTLNGETNPTSLLTFVSPTGRHQGGANYLMADGHTAFLLPSTISPGTNAASATSNQVDFGPTGNQYYNPAAGTAGHFSDGATVPAATFSIY